MKIQNRIISTFLAVIIMLGSLTSFVVVGASAASAKVDDVQAHYRNQKFKTPEEKLATMEKRLEHGDYVLYVDPISGEVAMQNVKTNDILFSNPYDAASSPASEDRYGELMSQIIIEYTGGGNGTLYSFTDAAMKGQIKVVNIRNGVRVEYTIGQDSVKRLVPKQIPAESFETIIMPALQEAVQAQLDAGGNKKVGISDFEYQQFIRYYTKKTIVGVSGYERDMILEMYPACANMDLYVLKNEGDMISVYNKVENLLKEHCKKYTFDQMDKDHAEAQYVADDEKFPVFKLALEYYLNDSGLSVILPCNGLRYDMSAYTLESISILPFMGAGNHTNDGYNFFPDGSGSLINFKQLNQNDTFSISGQIYGVDYAYQDLTSLQKRDIRFPVYGTVATENFYHFSFRTNYELDENFNLVIEDGKEKEGSLQTYDVTISNTVLSKETDKDGKVETDMQAILRFIEERHGSLVIPDGATKGITETSYKRGYVAIIESGESLAELETYQGGNTLQYNTVKNYFNPMPSDVCYMLDALSGDWWTLPQTSDTRYTGSIKIRYQMLTDPEKEITINGATNKVKNSGISYYETTWFGMAEAYRDHLVANGTLTKLTAQDLEQDIPLYVEVFGTLETQQTVLTIPVNVMTPLTTFDNVYDMYEELSEANVNNINFKLTGFANGGMYSTVPAALDWEDAVGGKEGFKELLERAASVNASADKNLGIYPDFDFAYIHEDTWFDSTSLKEDAVKTMDNRYSSKRQYSATKQAYITFYQLALSPSRYSHFYTELLENLAEYENLKGISISSLGHSLNSDFDEDDPYNREENKEFTSQAFRDMKAAGYSLMTESANAYTWGYVDHIINMNLDSSRHNRTSASVPFIGVVLHGYVQFAGTPLNEEGDIDYAMLRAIENGAGLYFILSYQNTQELKKDPVLSQYYSIRYDIWKEDVIQYYNELNSVLGDVQDKVIIGHEFLTGNRVLDTDELEEELNNQKDQAAKDEQEKQDQIILEQTLSFANAWKLIDSSVTEMNRLIKNMQAFNKSIAIDLEELRILVEEDIPETVAMIKEAHETGKPVTTDDDKEYTIQDLLARTNTKLATIRSLTISILKNCAEIEKLYENGDALLKSILEAKVVVAAADESTIASDTRDIMLAQADAYYAKAKNLYETTAKAAYESACKYNSKASDTYVVDEAMVAKTLVAPALEEIRADAAYMEENSLRRDCNSLAETLELFDEKKILDAGRLDEKVEIETDEVEDTKDKYLVDNNLIALVTYGTRENNVKVAYKSFILNYNNFAVTVVYNNVTYTIPSGDYVMIQY